MKVYVVHAFKVGSNPASARRFLTEAVDTPSAKDNVLGVLAAAEGGEGGEGWTVSRCQQIWLECLELPEGFKLEREQGE